MSSNRIIKSTYNKTEKLSLEKELRRAQEAYLDDEAVLAEEQAAVNAFRMHCRLKLDVLVDKLQDLSAEKQSKLTELAFMRQGIEFSWLDEEDDFFESLNVEDDMSEDLNDPVLILPTPTAKDKAAEKRLYRELARRFHPDLAKTAVEQSYRTMMMAAVNEAYAEYNLVGLYDLAGELDPQEISQLTGINNLEIRKLRREIFKFRQMSRKSRRKLSLLRTENTARLWRRAQIIEEEKDWWSIIRAELEKAAAKKQKEIDILQRELDLLQQEGVMS